MLTKLINSTAATRVYFSHLVFVVQLELSDVVCLRLGKLARVVVHVPTAAIGEAGTRVFLTHALAGAVFGRVRITLSLEKIENIATTAF